ncbi:hypothetical protein Q5P01_012372 [Channa striata]|uniref:Uncharacterized protein n=1 Tax=Channa striata TaxID=64152 RepID=A0AA88MPF2_CHASR|nr:hypothetical protein Q5P01_012372 [Channa striata]
MAKKETEKKPLKTQRKRRLARAAFYCMNEAELVEAAVSCLTAGHGLDPRTDQKVGDKAGDAALKIRKKPPSSKTKANPVADVLEEECCNDVSESTYISEKDLDITDVETLPYAKSPQHEGPEDQGSGQVQDHSKVMNVEVEADKRQEHSQMEADAAEDQDDALKLPGRLRKRPSCRAQIVSAHAAQRQSSVCPAAARFTLTCGLLRSVRSSFVSWHRRFKRLIMGNKASRRRDGPAIGAETGATEQQSAEEPGMTQTQEATETEDLDVVVGEPVTLVACLPKEECISMCKEVSAATKAAQNDTEQDPVAKEASAPVQNELLLPVSEPPLKSEPVAEAQLAQEPATEPEPSSNQATEIEAVAAPAEALEQQSETLTQESLPEPVLYSLPLINLGVPDVTLQSANSSPTPAAIHTQVNADKPSDIPAKEECLDHAEAAAISIFGAEKPEETSESLEEPMEATEDLEQLVSDIKDDSVSGLLKNLELEGNDTDLIPSDVKIPDDNPITDISTSTELM